MVNHSLISFGFFLLVLMGIASASNLLYSEDFDEQDIDQPSVGSIHTESREGDDFSIPYYSIDQTGFGGTGYCFGSGIYQDAYLTWMYGTLWPSDEMYVSFYMKYPSFTHQYANDNLKFFYPHWSENSIANYVAYSLYAGSDSMFYAAHDDTPPTLGTAITQHNYYTYEGMADGNWHKYEFYVKFSTGESRGWYDGELKVDETYGAVWQSPPNMAYLTFGAQDSEGDNDFTRFIDNIEVWDGMPGSAVSDDPVCEATGSGHCYYASPSGAGDCSFDSPCSIRAALSGMGAGDYLYLMDGTYSQAYSNYQLSAIINLDKYFDFHATEDDPVVIKAYPGHHPVIQSDYTNDHRCIWVDGTSHVVFEGLDIRQCWNAGIYLQEDSPVTDIIIRNCTFSEIVCSDNMGGVYVNGADNVLIEGNTFYDHYYQGMKDRLPYSDCRGSALHLFRATNVTISNNEFYNTCNGMYYKHGEGTLGRGGYTRITDNYWHDLSSSWCIGINQNRAELTGNVIDGCGVMLYNEDGTAGPFVIGVEIAYNTLIDSYITMNRGSDTVRFFGAINTSVHDNIFYNTDYNIWEYGSDAQYNRGIGLYSEDNCYYDETGSQGFNYFGNNRDVYGGANTGGVYGLAEWQLQGFDTGSIESDPLFIDKAAGNYNVQPGSPCSAMGASIDLPDEPGPVHDADTNSDGQLSVLEIAAYVNRWKIGQVSMSDLISAIKIWKGQ